MLRHSLTLTIGDLPPSAEPVEKESVKTTIVEPSSQVKENVPITVVPQVTASAKTERTPIARQQEVVRIREPLQSSNMDEMQQQMYRKSAPVQQTQHHRTASYFPELHAPLASEVKELDPIPPEDRQHYREAVAKDDWKLREAQRSKKTQAPIASVRVQHVRQPSQVDEPARPMVKTDALEEKRAAEETGESSELDSVGEKKSGVVEEKRLQKKPGRKDPRRLTAIYNPSGEGTSATTAEEPQTRSKDQRHVQESQPSVPRTQTIHVTLQAAHDDIDSRLRVMSSPRPFVSPDSGVRHERKQFSYYKAEEETTFVRPTELRGLPPLMKGSEVTTPLSEVSSLSQKFESPRPLRSDWKEASDIVDESDIMTISSRRSDDDGTVAASEMSDSPVRVEREVEREREVGLESFNKDESELVNMQKQGEDTDIDSEEEKERWMLEELMLAKKEEEMLKVGREWGRREEKEQKEQEKRKKEIDELQGRGRVRHIIQDLASEGAKTENEKRQEGRRAQRDRQQRRATTQLLEQQQFISEARTQQKVERTEEVSYHASLSRAHSEEQAEYEAWTTSVSDAGHQNSHWEPSSQAEERRPGRVAVSRDQSVTDRDEVSESDDWRQRAMQLLDEEGQFGRDLELVSRLNKQLEECRQLDEADRNKAIGCMIKHQQTLEKNQDRLSKLLESAIEFVRHMDDAVDEVHEETVHVTEEVPPPPMRRHYRDMEQHPGNPEVQAREEEDSILEELSRLAPPRAGPVIPEIDYPIDDDVAEYQQENRYSRSQPQTSNYKQQYPVERTAATVVNARGRTPETEP